MRLVYAGALALVLCVVGSAQAQSVRHGHLELIWGDAAPGQESPRQPRLYFADAQGGRERVDLDAARHVVDNLYALYGQEVQMTVAPGPWLHGQLVPEAIVASSTASNPELEPRVSGSQPWITLLCRFPDVVGPEPRSPAYFTELMSNEHGRLDHYWREVSYDHIDIAGSEVAGWYTLPHPRQHYVPDGAACFSDLRADLFALWDDCTAVADADVDFSQFVGINTMYNDELDGCAWGGGVYGTLDGVSKLWYSTWEPPWGYAHQAPLAHEMGHGFGLPHANNSDLDDDPYDNPWDVMSDAWSNAVPDAVFGWQPKHISAWSRDHLGWVDPPRKLVIDTDGVTNDIVLNRASLAESGRVQMIVVTLPPPEPASHYYVLEVRKRVAGYESELAGDAVIIHEIRENRVEPAWSVDADVPPADVSNNEGSMFKAGESWTAPNAAFTVDVIAETVEGFVLKLQRGTSFDRIFRDGFD